MLVDEIKWPKHEGGLYINHNPHRASYATVEEYMSALGNDDEWASPEERDKAIATDSLWTIQWYPDTPIGSYSVAASTLSAAMEALHD